MCVAETKAVYFKRRVRDYEDALIFIAIDAASAIFAAIYIRLESLVEISKVSKSMLQTEFNIKETPKFTPVCLGRITQ